MTEQERLTSELLRREAHLAEEQRLSHTGSFGWKPDTGEIVWSDETVADGSLKIDVTRYPLRDAVKAFSSRLNEVHVRLQ